MLQLWSFIHFESLVSPPSSVVSPQATLQTQELPVKTSSLHHQNCLEDSRAPHLIASEKTCIGAILGMGEGESDSSGHSA